MFAAENGTYTGAPLKGIAVGNGCSGNEVGSCGGERDKYDTEYEDAPPFCKHIDSFVNMALCAALNRCSGTSAPCQQL